jgi:hypothetical protein
VSISIAQHLWMTWLQVAADHAQAADQQRQRQLRLGASDEQFGPAMTRELQAAMVAISGAAHAIESLYGEIKPLVSIPESVRATWEANRSPRQARIFETIKYGCRLGSRTNTWPRRFDELYLLRDPLVHHELRTRPSVPHPNGLTNTSQEMADYTVESARGAVDFALDVMLTTIRTARADDLVQWADAMGHVPGALEAVVEQSRNAES